MLIDIWQYIIMSTIIYIKRNIYIPLNNIMIYKIWHKLNEKGVQKK